jgi:hypothetical protein
MAIIGVNYGGGERIGDEDDENYESIPRTPVEYKEVYLHLCGNDKEWIFDSGNFVKDWFEAKKKFLEFHKEEVSLGASSSVDHFIMDGAPYDSAYLVFKDDGDIGELTYEYDEKGWEMFVEKGTRPTWDELKKYCKEE